MASFGVPPEYLNGRRVRVYWNLHKRQYSVMDKRLGRVVGHANVLELADVTFIVQPGGRKRVLESGQKNVHAFIEGVIIAVAATAERTLLHAQDPVWEDAVELTYNPTKHISFVMRVGEVPVVSARRVALGYGWIAAGKDIGKRHPLVLALGLTFAMEGSLA